jgi:hypothetical protein
MVIGYYLNSKTEIDAYIEEGIRHAQEMQQKLNELRAAMRGKNTATPQTSPI